MAAAPPPPPPPPHGHGHSHAPGTASDGAVATDAPSPDASGIQWPPLDFMQSWLAPPSFPEMRVLLQQGPPKICSGDMTPEPAGVFINGHKLPSDVHFSLMLPRIVALRKGWGRQGERDDETIKTMARAFVREVLHRGNDGALTDGWPTESAMGCPVHLERAPPFEPPRTVLLVDANNRRIVRYSYWSKIPRPTGNSAPRIETATLAEYDYDAETGEFVDVSGRSW